MDSWRGTNLPSLPGAGGEPTLWDTATGAVIQAAAERTATIYACGITPYDATHIGHAATFLAWDLLVRAWRDAGHDVTYVQNVTDVDDPLLERAVRDGVDWRELADGQIARYRSDMEALRVLPPTVLVGAVEALPIIERFAARLAERGALYELDGDVYLSRAADPGFGSVSHFDAEKMIALSAERGGDPGRSGKKDPLDCLVWLAARPGEPSWESVFGPGRPGWHVECAAIAAEYLGAEFDVQAGGCDLVFPHHELSASHVRVALADNGSAAGAFARGYAHAGMVRLDGEKMSKSRGNLVFVSDLLAAGTDPMVVRLAILAHRYRHDWDWTEEGLAEAEQRLARWRTAVGLASRPGAGPDIPDADSVLAAVRNRIADDLDAPGALAAVDQWADAVIGGAAAGGQTGAAGGGQTGAAGGGGHRPEGGAAAGSPGALIRDTVDALLGVAV